MKDNLFVGPDIEMKRKMWEFISMMMDTVVIKKNQKYLLGVTKRSRTSRATEETVKVSDRYTPFPE